jgi:hypothetical protein
VLANRPQATAPVLDSTLQDVDMMREAVEERAGEPFRAEDRSPFIERTSSKALAEPQAMAPPKIVGLSVGLVAYC